MGGTVYFTMVAGRRNHLHLRRAVSWSVMVTLTLQTPPSSASARSEGRFICRTNAKRALPGREILGSPLRIPPRKPQRKPGIRTDTH